ncbi:MAG: acyl-CoA dehydrogenase family protein [Chloroflexi bacterium]|nr:acyl-CoA dehydrogenase family protein [Chloroflexota bacterium]
MAHSAGTLTVDTVVERARSLAEHFRARLPGYDASAVFPAENFDEIREAGLHAMTVPEEYGGLGLWQIGGHFVPYYEVLETLANADSSTAQLLQVHCHATGMIAALGTPEQREFYMTEVARDGRLIASIGSEAQLRSTEMEVYRAELVRRGEGYTLNARKAFASLAGGADYFNIWTAVEGEGGFADRMVLATIPRGVPGLTMVDDWDTMGMRHTTSWSLVLENVDVPACWVVGEPGAWVRKDQRTFTLAYTANHLGTAQGAFDAAAAYVAARPHLAKSEFIQAKLGHLSSELYATRCALYAAAQRWERGDDPNAAELDGVRALHIAKRVAVEVTSAVYDICGARAAYNVYPFNQALRDTRTFTLHFRDELYCAQVGRAELGEPFVVKGNESGSTPHDQA